jgi:hypothetical protein
MSFQPITGSGTFSRTWTLETKFKSCVTWRPIAGLRRLRPNWRAKRPMPWPRQIQVPSANGRRHPNTPRCVEPHLPRRMRRNISPKPKQTASAWPSARNGSSVSANNARRRRWRKRQKHHREGGNRPKQATRFKCVRSAQASPSRRHRYMLCSDYFHVIIIIIIPSEIWTC